ncbi:hypothetical protein D6777_03825 [Candidatus Woesearchaeota archaeon]|nr:MAG: hypothetical protein D6777_03825 [Candidatus Woesearchaeota archaeon]
MKNKIVDDVSIALLERNFIVKQVGCVFDVIAVKGEEKYLIKCLKEANSLTQANLENMKKVASYTNSIPVIVAQSSGQIIEDGVLYSRNGITTVNINTFTSIISKQPLYVKSSNAGFVVSLDKDKFKKTREEFNYSLNSLAKKLCVTPKMIKKYEQCDSYVNLITAERIFDLFGEEVFNQLSLKPIAEKFNDELTKPVARKYDSLGFSVTEIGKKGFDLLAKYNDETILTMLGDKINKNFLKISEVFSIDNLVVFKTKKPNNLDIATIKEDEFFEFEKPSDVLDYVKS